MSSDPWVARSQHWVNTTYGNVTGFVPAPETGQPNWKTMYALTRALQYELSISPLTDSFGPQTLSQLNTLGEIGPTTSNRNIIAIVQCALWCKGYAGGAYTAYAEGTYDATTGSSINAMRQDMGLTNGSTVPGKMFKSLLTLDAYVRVGDGTEAVRTIQRWMNSRYLLRHDYYIIPADGIYSRDVNRGLMLSIQYEIGMADGVANGNFGPGTQQGLKDYGSFGSGSTESSTRRLLSLYQAALIFNQYTCTFSGTFDSNTLQQTNAFQAFSGLTISGRSDYATWASLLTSTGDPSRTATGFDSNRKQSAAALGNLKAKGFSVAGRYISGDVNSSSGKCIDFAEPALLFANGFKWLPLFQENNNSAPDFATGKGYPQGQRAVTRARAMGLAANSTVFISVDFDATSDDLVNLVIPHFQRLKDAFNESRTRPYKLGVYGTRNVCSRLAKEGLTTASFVSDLSTGYSGNLGFPLPQNWHYDQIQNVSASSTGLGYDIDRNVVSSRAEPLGAGQIDETPILYSGGTAVGFDSGGYWATVGAVYKAESVADPIYVTTFDLMDIVLEWIQKANPDYTSTLFKGYAPSSYLLQPAGPRRDALLFAATDLSTKAPTVDFPYPDIKQFGDTPHFAVSTRGYLTWGVATVAANPKVAFGDLGAWAFDLVSLWNNYERARLARADKTLGVADWFRAHTGVGPKDSSSFSEPDLRADLAAYLLADRLKAAPDTSLSEHVRSLMLACQSDPGYLPRTFYSKRFGADFTNATQAAVSVWDPTNWKPTNDWALSAFIDSDVRRPGSASASGSSTGAFDPPASVRAGEQTAVAVGFANALLDAASNWTLR